MSDDPLRLAGLRWIDQAQVQAGLGWAEFQYCWTFQTPLLFTSQSHGNWDPMMWVGPAKILQKYQNSIQTIILSHKPNLFGGAKMPPIGSSSSSFPYFSSRTPQHH